MYKTLPILTVDRVLVKYGIVIKGKRNVDAVRIKLLSKFFFKLITYQKLLINNKKIIKFVNIFDRVRTF